jgi:hypothetical protein
MKIPGLGGGGPRPGISLAWGPGQGPKKRNIETPLRHPAREVCGRGVLCTTLRSETRIFEAPRWFRLVSLKTTIYPQKSIGKLSKTIALHGNLGIIMKRDVAI